MSGNYLSGPKQLTATTTKADASILVAPDYLDAALIPIFEAVASEVPVGLARSPDVRLIVQLVQAIHIQSECWQKIMSDGVLTVDNTHGGELRRHPAVVVWRQATDMARQCMNLLGMSPAARARIQEPGGAEGDPFEEFLRRRRPAATDA